MIKLLQFPSYFGLPNASPFCLKLETYLRMANVPFQIVSVADPRKSPKGKLPCLLDGERLLTDSSLIIDHLKKTHGDPLDTQLTPQQKAQALALQRMLEEHLYWTVLYSRWVEPANWLILKQEFFGKLPFPLQKLIPALIRKRVIKDLHAHGTGRHSSQELYQLGLADLAAVQATLADQAYVLGQEPTSIDASVYAFLVNIMEVPIASPLKDYAKKQTNFVDYCARMKKRFYSS